MFGLFKKQEPVTIRDTYGVFALEKGKHYYTGSVDWLGEQVGVTLYCDGREQTTADKALTHFRKLMAEVSLWDKRIKDRCAEDMVNDDGMVEIWAEDEDEEPVFIPREEFRKQLRMGFVLIHADGSLYFDLSTGQAELFADHGIGVDADISGTIEGACVSG
jgi:hypothetical protein